MHHLIPSRLAHSAHLCPLCSSAKSCQERQAKCQRNGELSPHERKPLLAKIDLKSLEALASRGCPLARAFRDGIRNLSLDIGPNGEVQFEWTLHGSVVLHLDRPNSGVHKFHDITDPPLYYTQNARGVFYAPLDYSRLGDFLPSIGEFFERSIWSKTMLPMLSLILGWMSTTNIAIAFQKTSIGQLRAPPTDLMQRIGLAKKWLHGCMQQHHACRRRYENINGAPKRLLEICEISGELSVKLIETSKTFAPYLYSCLSYCWGKKTTFKLLKDNIDRVQKGISAASLPQTLRDAIWVSQNLEIPYIWIDALCIIQDDKADWDSTAPLMARVYGSSMITIAAGRALESGEGFLQPPIIASQTHAASDVSDANNQRISVRPFLSHNEWSPDFRNSIEAGARSDAGQVPGRLPSPLATRAWALQEHLLPSRSILFNKEEMIWECVEGMQCECELRTDYRSSKSFEPGRYHRLSSKSQIFDMEKSSNSKVLILESWARVLEQYIPRGLTFGEDRLLALSGVAERLIPAFGNYVAGLWERYLLSCLTWRTQGASRPSEYRAPSFSWASLEHGKFTWYPEADIVELADVLDVKCSSTGPTGTGKITSGHLIMRTSVRRTTAGELQGASTAGREILKEKPVDLHFDVEEPAAEQQLSLVAISSSASGLQFLICKGKEDDLGSELTRIGIGISTALQDPKKLGYEPNVVVQII